MYVCMYVSFFFSEEGVVISYNVILLMLFFYRFIAHDFDCLI